MTVRVLGPGFLALTLSLSACALSEEALETANYGAPEEGYTCGPDFWWRVTKIEAHINPFAPNRDGEHEDRRWDCARFDADDPDSEQVVDDGEEENGSDEPPTEVESDVVSEESESNPLPDGYGPLHCPPDPRLKYALDSGLSGFSKKLSRKGNTINPIWNINGSGMRFRMDRPLTDVVQEDRSPPKVNPEIAYELRDVDILIDPFEGNLRRLIGQNEIFLHCPDEEPRSFAQTVEAEPLPKYGPNHPNPQGFIVPQGATEVTVTTYPETWPSLAKGNPDKRISGPDHAELIFTLEYHEYEPRYSE